MSIVTNVLSPALNPGYYVYEAAANAWFEKAQAEYIADRTMQDLIGANAGRFFKAEAAHKLLAAKAEREKADIALAHAEEAYRLLNRNNRAQLFFGGHEAGNGEKIAEWDARFNPKTQAGEAARILGGRDPK